MADESRMTVFCALKSYYSQLVLMVLEEKGLKHMVKYHTVGPVDVWQPWYARMNPKMFVPTMTAGDKVLIGSTEIVDYLEEKFPDRPLRPPPDSELGTRCERIMKIIDTQPDGDDKASLAVRLSFGTFSNMKYTENTKLSAEVMKTWNMYPDFVKSKAAALDDLVRQNPDLADVYRQKVESATKHYGSGFDEESYVRSLKEADEMLARVEQELSALPGDTAWMCGQVFTLADIYLAVLLYRLDMLGLSNRLFLSNKPRLSKYFQAVKQRDSVASVLRDAYGAALDI